MFKKIISIVMDKSFWINAILALVLLVITGWIAMLSLKVVTKWGQSEIVPNVMNKNVDEAIEKIEHLGFEYEIKDSVYRKDIPSGTVVDVQPAPGLDIKSGRTIFLVISSKKTPLVEMPGLVGRSSLRFAKLELETRGLNIGSLSYIPSTEKDAVLSQRIGNTEVSPGTMIPKGTTINLTLGDGLSGVIIDPPFLIGKTKNQILELLKVNGIHANFYFDKTVKDTANAVAYKQYPAAHLEEKLNVGETMDVFLAPTIPENILKDSALKARLSLEE